MLAYIVRRLTLVAPTLALAALLVFLVMRAIPGDPALLFVGDPENQQAIAEKRIELGLDKPVYEQFARWVSGMVRGDLGQSVSSGQPVAAEIADTFPVTAQIVILSIVLAAAIAIPAGMYAAWRQDSAGDLGVVAFATLCLS